MRDFIRDFIWDMVPSSWYDRIAWLMIVVFKSKNKAWLAIYKTKLGKDGYIQEATNYRQAEVNKAVVNTLQEIIDERAQKRKK